MVRIIEGDLMNAQCDIIAHQVNCQGAFNSGVAKAIREKFPEVFEKYKNFCDRYTPDFLLGSIQYCILDNDDRLVVNLFAQKNYGYDGKQYTNMLALKQCFERLHNLAEYFNKKTIALPYKIGCVRGGADWNEVYKLIEETFCNDDVVLYKLDKG